jgi:hypothetical protein
MSTWIWVVIVAAIVLGLASVAWPTRDTEPKVEPRRTSWPEWDRAVAKASPPRPGGSPPSPRWGYTRVERLIERWRLIQERFADDPDGAILQADELLREVMREHGYAVDQLDRLAASDDAHLSQAVKHYRAAHAISEARARGESAPEDTRVALVHYRLAFEELLEI